MLPFLAGLVLLRNGTLDAVRCCPTIQEATMSKEISRREFLENVGLGAAAGTSLLLLKDIGSAQSEKSILPTRTLGRTNAKVSILAFGCGSRFLMYKDVDSATGILNHAIDLGIT